MRIENTNAFPQDGTLREQDVLMYAVFDEDDTSIEFMPMTAILKPTFTLGGESINSTITSIEMGGFRIYELVDFDITVDEKEFDVQISKIGCLLITASSYAEGADAIISKEQAVELAQNFANNIGFENMSSVWAEVKFNVAYINLAPIENGIIMYPDLVKVKVDLTSQEIIGFEAVNYAFNHVERNFEFVLSEGDAKEKLGFDYEIISTITKIGKKYENHPAVVHTILGYVDYLEHEGSGRSRK